MIEIIYQGEQKTEEQDSDLKLPKNVRQIGELEGETKKIYVEDFVMTFVKHFSSRHLKYGVLLGNSKKNGGNTYLFITGAVCAHPVIDNDIIFDEEVWTGIYEDIKTYFDEVEIVGWFVSMPGLLANDMAELWKLHLDNFAGNDKVCFVLDRVECEDSFYLYDDGGMKKCEGHYIYYAKNGDMQSYMMMHEETSEIPADYEQTSKQAINAKVHRLLYNINTEREPVKKKNKEKNKNALLQAVLTGGMQKREMQEKAAKEKAAKEKKTKEMAAKGIVTNVMEVKEMATEEGQEVMEKAGVTRAETEGGGSTELTESHGTRHRLPVFAYSASSFLLLAILMGAVAIMVASGQLHALRGTVTRMANVGVTDKQGTVTDKLSKKYEDDASVIDVEADVTTAADGSAAGDGNVTDASAAGDGSAADGSAAGDGNAADGSTAGAGTTDSGRETAETVAGDQQGAGGNVAEDEKSKEDESKTDGSKTDGSTTDESKTDGSTAGAGTTDSGQETAETVAGDQQGADEKTASESESGKAAAEDENVKKEITYYTVKQGDTLYSISLKIYGNVNRIDDIRKANEMASDEENIAIGQRLVLP